MARSGFTLGTAMKPRIIQASLLLATVVLPGCGDPQEIDQPMGMEMRKTERIKLSHFSKLGGSLGGDLRTELSYVLGKAKQPTEAQRKMAAEFLAKEADLFKAAREKIYAFYKTAYPDYKKGWQVGAVLFGGGKENIEEFLPEVKRGNELDDKIRLLRIYVGTGAQIGLEFQCSWDEEHGIGVLLQDLEVVEAGPSHIAYVD